MFVGNLANYQLFLINFSSQATKVRGDVISLLEDINRCLEGWHAYSKKIKEQLRGGHDRDLSHRSAAAMAKRKRTFSSTNGDALALVGDMQSKLVLVSNMTKVKF